VVPGYYFWNGTAWIQISNGLIVDASKTSNFSVAAADNNKLFLINSSISVTVTVPPGLPIGFACQFIQTGAGAVILLGGSGVTLNSANGLTSRAANSAVGLVLSSSTVGYVFGDTIN
jgi:Na+/glutamate symporter